MQQVDIDVTGASTAALVLAAHTLQALVRKGLLHPQEQAEIMREAYSKLAEEGQVAMKAVYPGFAFPQ